MAQQIISVETDEDPIRVIKDISLSDENPIRKLESWQWWILVIMNIAFLLLGQVGAVLLGRFYYDKGGKSNWLATLLQTAAFPILFIPYFIIKRFEKPSEDSSKSSSPLYISLIYLVLGAMIAADNMLYSIGLRYLSASTYSLISATQLISNAIFSFFINKQKFTDRILNSVVVLTASAALIAINGDSSDPSGISKGKFFLGFLTTLGASTIYSLILSLMQLSFEKVIKKDTFSVVLEMQIYTSLVATIIGIIGLFVSGEWKTLHEEMISFSSGHASYVMIVVFNAVTWQICAVGVVGLIYVVSSLFSNVISTLSLAITPLAALIFFRDKMGKVKIVAMLLAFWGFASYIRQKTQNYIDDRKVREADRNAQQLKSAW